MFMVAWRPCSQHIPGQPQRARIAVVFSCCLGLGALNPEAPGVGLRAEGLGKCLMRVLGPGLSLGVAWLGV